MRDVLVPLYAYAHRRVSDIGEAQNLTQAFFAELLEKNVIGAATPDRGRFRSFLLTAFSHFLSKERDQANAQKRGGGRLKFSLDFQSAESGFRMEPAAGLTAEQIFDQRWAIALLSRILDRLEAEFRQSGNAARFEELRDFLIGDHAAATYAQAAGKLGMTEAAARKACSRMRQRYGQLLREEIAQTVAGPEDVDGEIQSLFHTLQS